MADADLAYAIEWGGKAWRELAEEALDAVPVAGLEVLEIGGRSGRFAAYLASQGARVTTIDLDKSVLRSAPLEAERLGVTVDARVDPGDLSSVSDSAYDVVFTKSVLVVVPDPSYVDAIAGKLRPRGRIVAIENEPGPPGLRVVRLIRHGRSSVSRFRFFDSVRWAELAERFDPIHTAHRRWPPVGLFVGRLKPPSH